MELAEHAHRLADAAIQYVDDSDGCLTDISSRLGELHLRACELGDPDPLDLAHRLVDLELTSELDAFHQAALTYADILDDEGLAEYRRVIEPRWAALDSGGDRWSSGPFRIRNAMVAVARAGGDPDDFIRVKRQDLGHPGDYAQVVKVLRGAERRDEAIDWGRRGLAAFPDRASQASALREMLAELLRETGDSGAALDLFREAFEMVPSLEGYRRLVAEAEVTGTVDEVRASALDALRSQLAGARPAEAADVGPGARSTPAEPLVEILLFEGEAEAGWDVAREHGCSSRLWLTLARAQEATHPLDSIGVYRPEVFAQIETKKNHGYRSAVDLMARIRTLATEAGEPERFEDLLDEVRTTHKPKRNLMALLRDKGW